MLGAVLISSAILLPPAKYDVDFHGPVIVKEDARTACRPGNNWGCAVPGNGYGTCLVHVLPVGGRITRAVQRQIIRHEIGHCNGWGYDHK